MHLRGIFLALACAFASVPAFAVTDDFTPGGFYTAEALPWRPAHFRQVVDATLQLGNDCSGVGLSRDGYVATALHCVAECFRPAYDYEPAVKQRVFAKPDHFRARAIDESHPASFRCPDHIARQFSPTGLSTDLFDLVWVGRGQHEHKNERLGNLSAAEFASIADLTEDVVVLKFHPGRDQGAFPCLPIAAKHPAPGARLWSVGFPSRAHRADGLASDGVRRFFSPGYVRTSLDGDPALTADLSSLAEPTRALAWEREKRLWERPHLLLSSVDAVGGNSGGLMVDAEGRAAGILFTVMRTSHERYLGSTVVGFRTPELRRRIAKDLGARKAEEIFACEFEPGST